MGNKEETRKETKPEKPRAKPDPEYAASRQRALGIKVAKFLAGGK